MDRVIPDRSVPRVLQVVLSLNPGGTERLVVELASRLHASVPMAVCCLDEPGAWAETLSQRGIDVSHLGRRPGFRPGLGRAIAREAARHNATVIHAHQYSPFVYGAIARLWRPATRLVFTEHGRLSDGPPSTRRRLANRFLSVAPYRVFTVSGDLKRHLIAEGFGENQVAVIHNGIDIKSVPSPVDRERIRRTLGVPDDAFVIGTVARLDPVNDLGTLVDAVSHLVPERRVRLIVVGDGPELTRLKEMAAGRGIANEVRFLGHRDDARSWLAGFDVFVNSSTSEGVSLTILEAMAAGLPVVATEVGGTPEVVTDECGYLVPPRDSRRLADALRRLLGDPTRREDLGRRARLRVEQRFRLGRMISDYHAVYRAAASPEH
jgi:glycosyltransferase involved in cell wall biosynthesis